jgi:menaquinone-dependent protoporphyrinogen oxidase
MGMTPFKRVLVTFGSKRGSTEEIAREIASTLRATGMVVDVAAAGTVSDVTPYHAVVIGGSLYMMRWSRDAKHFVRRHAAELRRRQVWMFSSGPLDGSASERVISPVPNVAALMAEVGARGHATFGGRLESDADGWIASAMAKNHAGDWRDWQRIRNWAREIANDIELPGSVKPVPRPRASGGALAALCILVGAMAIIGGIALVLWPDGSAIRLPLDMLATSPFESFLIPGLILLVVIGLGNTIAGALLCRNTPRSDIIAFVAGLALFGWTVIQIAMVSRFSALQLGSLVVGFAIVALSMRLRGPITA